LQKKMIPKTENPLDRLEGGWTFGGKTGKGGNEKVYKGQPGKKEQKPAQIGSEHARSQESRQERVRNGVLSEPGLPWQRGTRGQRGRKEQRVHET